MPPAPRSPNNRKLTWHNTRSPAKNARSSEINSGNKRKISKRLSHGKKSRSTQRRSRPKAGASGNGRSRLQNGQQFSAGSDMRWEGHSDDKTHRSTSRNGWGAERNHRGTERRAYQRVGDSSRAVGGGFVPRWQRQCGARDHNRCLHYAASGKNHGRR